MLAREGLGAGTTRRITDEAGLALGAFRYAFRNKDDLLEAAPELQLAQFELTVHALRDPRLRPHRIVEDDPEAARRRLELFISTLPAPADQLRRRHNSTAIRSA